MGRRWAQNTSIVYQARILDRNLLLGPNLTGTEMYQERDGQEFRDTGGLPRHLAKFVGKDRALGTPPKANERVKDDTQVAQEQPESPSFGTSNNCSCLTVRRCAGSCPYFPHERTFFGVLARAEVPRAPCRQNQVLKVRAACRLEHGRCLGQIRLQ